MPRLDKDVLRFRASCFALEALTPRRLVRKVRGQDLDGDDSVEARVTRAVHFTHPAHSDLRDDLISAESCAGTQHEMPRFTRHFAWRLRRRQIGVTSYGPKRWPGRIGIVSPTELRTEYNA